MVMVYLKMVDGEDRCSGNFCRSFFVGVGGGKSAKQLASYDFSHSKIRF